MQLHVQGQCPLMLETCLAGTVAWTKHMYAGQYPSKGKRAALLIV